jgi:hypothetical protein
MHRFSSRVARFDRSVGQAAARGWAAIAHHQPFESASCGRRDRSVLPTNATTWHDARVPAHRTPDGRWIVVEGRRWRAADPELPEQVRARLLHHLGTAQSAVRAAKRTDDDAAMTAARVRVEAAKRGLGERGTPWWEQDSDARRERWTAALDELDPS